MDVDYTYCWDEDKVVKDRTCIFSVDHDCGKFKPKDGKGSVTCEKVPTKKCYDTPRKVIVASILTRQKVTLVDLNVKFVFLMKALLNIFQLWVSCYFPAYLAWEISAKSPLENLN